VLNAKVKAMLRLVEMQRTLVHVTEQLNEANAKLQRQSATDGLTGIPNRRMYDEQSIREWRRCERMKKPLALVMIDVDNFKLFNDRYGHQVGDECLKAVASQVGKAAPRATDLAARYGGEEFVIVLGETDTDGAKWIANRLRQQVSDLKIPHYATESRHVTISCGVASVIPDGKSSLDILLKSADFALYQAKESGRDRVGAGQYGVIEKQLF
jgi:diguanylate cyclase (GGDEF)-like protein